MAPYDNDEGAEAIVTMIKITDSDGFSHAWCKQIQCEHPQAMAGS